MNQTPLFTRFTTFIFFLSKFKKKMQHKKKKNSFIEQCLSTGFNHVQPKNKKITIDGEIVTKKKYVGKMTKKLRFYTIKFHSLMNYEDISSIFHKFLMREYNAAPW